MTTAFPPAQPIAVNGVTLSVHLAGPEDGLPVLLCHGWPELAYSWKNQIPALVDIGCRVIAPDQRGFGASDAPREISAYGVDHLVGDLAGLLDALGHDQAVYVGHDWGGIVVWHAAMLTPARVKGVIGVNTPHLPRAPIPITEVFRARGGEEHYIVQAQEEGKVEAIYEAHIDKFFEFVFGKPPPAKALDKLPPSVTHLPQRLMEFKGRDEADMVVAKADRRVFTEAYRKSGFRGGVNWYRNFDANWARMEGVDHHIPGPALMVSADADFMLPPALTQWMPDLVDDLEMKVIEGCGHWTQWEAPQALNAHMTDWLQRRMA